MADLRWGSRALRKELDVLNRKVLARRIGCALDNYRLGVVEIVRQADVVPARVANTACVTGLIAVYRAREVGPSEIIHVHGLRDIGACSRAASTGLIIVYLRDEDGEGHVVCADVAPGDVLREALATRPTLESCSI